MAIVTTSARRLSLDEAESVVRGGGVFVDLRRVADYLDAHIKGSICLEYEYGPGMPSRARDCLPLDRPLVILRDGSMDPLEIAAALRGKGFTVPGYVPDGVTRWGNKHGFVASTDTVGSASAPEGALLNVGDPGSPLLTGCLYIPTESLWNRVDELPNERIVVMAGRGVRAAMAVGILEGAGREVVFWRCPPRRSA